MTLTASPPATATATPEAEAAEPSSEPELHLIRPLNKKSKFWQYFSEFDLDFHADKKHIGRCNLCGKELLVGQGTGGLSNHLKFVHPDEYKSLHVQGCSEGARSSSTTTTTTTAAPAVNNLVDSSTIMSQPTLQDITSRTNLEKSMKVKNDFEIWALVRRELRDLELEREEKEIDGDDIAVAELEQDIKNLKKMKATFACLIF